MPYDEKFYERYGKYLREPIVRSNHNHAFDVFASVLKPDKPWVIDFGCGTGEYATYDQHHADYAGIDLANPSKLPNFIQADYRKLDLRSVFGIIAFADRIPFIPNSFISLFSTEISMPAEEKYAFYEKVFRALPSIRVGVVSGFFYESRRHERKVRETGGIESYQTIEDPVLHIYDAFTEMRMHMRTPSEMFGGDVIEVWKIFLKK